MTKSQPRKPVIKPKAKARVPAAPGKSGAALKAHAAVAGAATHPRSPLAPPARKPLPAVAGVRLASAAAGIKYSGRTDVMVAELAPGTQVAGVFTRSKAPSAPVDWCRTKLARGTARGLVVNSGNANAFTGQAGKVATREVAQAAAAALGCSSAAVFLASTGVIGEPLPAHKITAILPQLCDGAAKDGWEAAARAIMTTDTYPKLATASAKIAGSKIRINGIAKGSGMIAPDMATMLAFVFTDAVIPAAVLQDLLSDGVARSFNCITVDSDTSTSDTLLLFATGQVLSHPRITRASDPRLADFRRKLDAVLLDLALQVVRDGEGAQKLIEVDIRGAKSDASAHRIAMSIANSPLVKTAIAGGDANWGRIVMAVGKAGEPADRDRLKIAFGGHVVAEGGTRARRYDEARASAAVAQCTVKIAVDIGLGRGRARVWTCDLTEGYIHINGAYRS